MVNSDPSSVQTTRIDCGTPGFLVANSKKRWASCCHVPCGGSRSLLTVNASFGCRPTPATLGDGGCSSDMVLMSALMSTSESSDTPRTIMTPPSPNRIVAACGSTVDFSATLPFARPIACANLGVRDARSRLDDTHHTVRTCDG